MVAIIVSSCVVFIIIAIIFFARKKIFEACDPIVSKYMIQRSTIIFQHGKGTPFDPSKSGKVLTVPILYAQDDPQQQEVIMALHNFLKECCNVDPIIGENNPHIFINNPAWVQNSFDFIPSEDDDNKKRKIVIVETDAAVRLYQHWLNPKGRLRPEYRNYGHLDDVFLRGLSQLTSNPEFLQPSHDRIVVIHFNYFSDSNKIHFFKQRRFYLPNHLVELFGSLWDVFLNEKEKESLLNAWEGKQSYKELLRTTTKMQTFVENNPNYLDEYVFGGNGVV